VHAARRREQLQRDALAELEIVGAVDLAGGAAAEKADDAIAVGEEAPGRKSRVPERLERRNARRTRAVEASDGRFVAERDVAMVNVRSGILRDSPSHT
jgi:hypothetical protein